MIECGEQYEIIVRQVEPGGWEWIVDAPPGVKFSNPFNMGSTVTRRGAYRKARRFVKQERYYRQRQEARDKRRKETTETECF